MKSFDGDNSYLKRIDDFLKQFKDCKGMHSCTTDVSFGIVQGSCLSPRCSLYLKMTLTES